MSSPDRPRRAAPSRETRLLLLTIAVSVAALLLLAQFRFPDRPRGDLSLPAPAPLERLAARATYDDLAAIVVQLERRVRPALLVLRVSQRPAVAPAAADPFGAGPDRTRFVPALRFGAELAVALLPPDTRVQGIVGLPDALPVVLGVDPVRHLVLLRVPQAAETAAWVWDRAELRSTPHYVIVAEGTRGGPALRPVFLNRADPMSDPRWDRPLLSLSASLGLEPGSLIFSLDGRLVGLGILEGDLPAVVPADLLWDITSQLAAGELGEPADLGLRLQDLTRGLSAVTGASHGAIVADVDPAGPSAGLLKPGDVIEGVDGQPVGSIDELHLRLARTQPDTTVSLGVLRRGARLTVPIEARGRPPDPPAGEGIELGLTLRNVPRTGVEIVRVDAGTAGARAGLEAGDVIWLLDGDEAPAAVRLTGAFAGAEPGTHFLLGVERAGRRFVTTVEKR